MPVDNKDEETPGYRLPDDLYRAMGIDPNYCGLGEANTGKRDPWWKNGTCRRHDKAFNELIESGKGNDAETFLNFAGDVIGGMAEGLYMFVSGPIYLLIGGVGGLFRWPMVIPKDKIKPDPPDKPEAWE